jgi:hypothetical protein
LADNSMKLLDVCFLGRLCILRIYVVDFLGCSCNLLCLNFW